LGARGLRFAGGLPGWRRAPTRAWQTLRAMVMLFVTHGGDRRRFDWTESSQTLAAAKAAAGAEPGREVFGNLVASRKMGIQQMRLDEAMLFLTRCEDWKRSIRTEYDGTIFEKAFLAVFCRFP